MVTKHIKDNVLYLNRIDVRVLVSMQTFLLLLNYSPEAEKYNCMITQFYKINLAVHEGKLSCNIRNVYTFYLLMRKVYSEMRYFMI